MLTAALLSAVAVAAQSTYHEQLALKQSLDGKVAAVFSFQQASPSSSLYHPLAAIANEFGVAHIDFGFSQGKAGACVGLGLASECLPPGLLSLATRLIRLSSLNSSDPDLRWTGLTNALAGTFCASMNFITPKVSAEPKESLRVNGVDPDSNWLRYATLPREITCTENLTPWAKLLPCSTKAGIATLFNAYSLYDADYHSMRVKLQRTCPTPSTCDIKIVQELIVVLDPVRKGHERNINWSLKFLFDREISGLCPLDLDGTDIVLELPASSSGFTFTGDVSPLKVREGLYKISLELGKKLGFGVVHSNSAPNRLSKPTPPVQIHRHLTGYGRERGGINIRINNNQNKPQKVTLLEVIPWYLHLYLHTLKTTTAPIGDLEAAPFTLNITQRYQPSIPRLRPSIIEISTVLPSNSVTTFHYEFDRAFIKYTEHPPDANRGFDIGPASFDASPRR
ncbi:Gpi16 subunit, GPI transamidase component-domain-containing protein [Obelidium mucronatum]|nr:Gpi16 subunit, GPI transamidase component-domain-containing protein [Obelidium mucronatum]